jgi:hypothetical protein
VLLFLEISLSYNVAILRSKATDLACFPACVTNAIFISEENKGLGNV